MWAFACESGKKIESLGCQLYVLKDEKGVTVEDCISTALSGNDVYASTLVNGEGDSFLEKMRGHVIYFSIIFFIGVQY